ncbi:signal peptidase I [Microbacterium sp. NPDC096154]|uniref:signal peptidase I n=1 Tax=Microbacterium sp. NPDC096154 TaxID=3155549 RepID=UPI00331DCDD8
MAAADALEETTPERVNRGAEILRSLLYGLSVGVFGLVLLLAGAVVVAPAVVGGVPLTILTGSMTPTYPPGTLVVVKPTPIEQIGVGDVLTFQLESGQPTLVTHRVVSVIADSSGETRFVTQGDANTSPDADPVRPVQIRGTVWYAVPWIGWANQAVNGEARSWLVPAAAAALFAYALWLVLSGIRDRRRRSRK